MTSAPYSPTGNFTDGAKWTTDLAQMLGATAPSQQENFAYESATASTLGVPNPFDPNASKTPLDTFAGQIQQFQQQDRSFSPNEVVSVTFGGNDISLPNNVPPDQGVTLSVNAIISGLQQLADVGAKHFLISNLPDIALAPLFSEWVPPHALPPCRSSLSLLPVASRPLRPMLAAISRRQREATSMDQPPSPSAYPAAYADWMADPHFAWARAAEGIDWTRRWDRVFDPASGPFGRWFPGAELNTCANCLDRHVLAGRGDRPALIWDSAMEGRVVTLTYAQMLDRTARVAGALAALGVGRGDRVIIYMPMVPEAAIAMLACARLGAVHSVVFGGFAGPELAKRIADAQPVAVVFASCGLEPGRVVPYAPMIAEAFALSPHQPRACLVLQRPMLQAPLVPGRDHDFAEAEAAATPHPPVSIGATDPLYVLYTSGTTGKPKGVVRDAGGHAVALHHSIDMIYGLQPGDVMWTASDVGWVVGHSYIVYAPLLAGCTTVMYEGKPVGTPDAAAFWRVCARHGVRVLFTAPTALRAIKQQDPAGALLADHDLSRLDALYLAGERCDPPTADWIGALLQRPVVDHWWQTETGWPITANFRGYGLFPSKSGSGGCACPGYDVRALDEAGQPAAPGQVGNLMLRLPLPPGCAPTLWGSDDAYRAAYLADTPGWYTTGDAGSVDADGDVWVMGRTDDIINVAGHRLSTGALEEVLAAHPDVAECAVVGALDPLKGSVPVGLVVLKAGVNRADADVARELVALVRERIGPVAAFKDARVVARLPKTRSGKILRASLRRLADGQAPAPPPTIDDPAILDEIAAVLAR